MDIAVMFLTVAVALVIAIVPLAVILWLAWPRLWLKTRRETDSELERQVFDGLRDYAKWLGVETPAVAEYLAIVDRGDVVTLRKRWGDLERSMRKRERELGHTGRPAILDYHCYYDTALKELARRRRHGEENHEARVHP